MRTITIHRRFAGPPGIGNGGYVCGLLGSELAGPARVTLCRPIPLEQPLHLELAPESGVRLVQGGAVLADAQAAELHLPVPERIDYETAAATAADFLQLAPHPAPGCFVCGTERAAGDGLRLCAGRLPGARRVAAAWQPHRSLADASGAVRTEFLWAALDCPGYYAAMHGEIPRMALLAQMTARVERSIAAEERCVVIGWQVSRSGRKHVVGTALFNESGRLCGSAQSLWIETDGARRPEQHHPIP